MSARSLTAARRPVALLAALALAVAFAVLLSTGTQARAEVYAGQDAYVDVQAATLWTNAYQARSRIDRFSTADQTNLTAWERAMNSFQKSWLIGKTQTQALYGQKVRVLRTSGSWAKVAVRGQQTPKSGWGYPGWVPRHQLTPNKNADISNDELIIQVNSKYGLLYKDRALTKVDHSVGFGTRLPVIEFVSGRAKVAAPGGGHRWMSRKHATPFREGRVRLKSKPTPDKVVNRALRFKGTPYIWGGTSSYGLDCSGLTYQVYRSFGIDLPRDAADQRARGAAVRYRDIRKGDLLFFGSSPRNITHVAMYSGNGRIVHAPFNGSKVVVEDLRASGQMSRYQGARRYL